MAEFSKVDEGWAMLSFVPDQVRALRSASVFSVSLDRGLQNFNLKEAEPAIDKALVPQFVFYAAQ